VDTYQAAARLAIKGEVDASFFLADAFASLTRMSRSQLRVLVESAISDISHVVLAHPRVVEELPRIEKALLAIGQESGDSDVLDALGLPSGFEPMTQEEAEFMIDLMDTLLD
jgi:phosphonate transport system substrate-binding protein